MIYTKQKLLLYNSLIAFQIRDGLHTDYIGGSVQLRCHNCNNHINIEELEPITYNEIEPLAITLRVLNVPYKVVRFVYCNVCEADELQIDIILQDNLIRIY